MEESNFRNLRPKRSDIPLAEQPINGGPYRARTGPPGLQSPCAPNNTYSPLILNLERGKGIEPSALAWKARVLPLYEPRIISFLIQKLLLILVYFR